MEKPYSPGVQLLILFGVIVFCTFIAQEIFRILIVSIYSESAYDTSIAQPSVIMLYAFLFQLFAHVVSFFLFLKITRQTYASVIDFAKIKVKILIWIPLIMVLSLPVMQFFSYLSVAVFEAVENYSFVEADVKHQAETAALFTHNSSLRFVMSLFVFAALPAIAEELIYRGVLLKKIVEATNNKHFSILVSGFIFGAFHMQPISLLSISVMGILLGYLYLYTRNIWYNILLHFLINATQIILIFFWPDWTL